MRRLWDTLGKPNSHKDVFNVLVNRINRVLIFSMLIRRSASQPRYRRFHILRAMAYATPRKVVAKDGHYDASADLEWVSERVQMFDAEYERYADAVDLFCGKGNFSNECQKKGKTSIKIDILEDSENHNLLTKTGFFYVLCMLLSVVTSLNCPVSFKIFPPISCFGKFR